LQADLLEGPILIETYEDALKFCDRANPQTTIEAKFSLQHSVAVSLVKGEPDLADFIPENTSDAILALRKRITVKEANEFTTAYPAHYGAAVTIAGNRYVAKDAYGDPEYPMDNEAVIQKAVALMTYADMGEEKSKRLASAALKGDLNNYLDLLP